MSILEKFKTLYLELCDFENNKIPLCAAETYISDFVKQGLPSVFEGKYAMGLQGKADTTDFIGSDYLFRLFDLLREQCKMTFGADYTDARPLTGMNCLTTVLMALKTSKKKPLRAILTMPEHGGHASVPGIMDVLNMHHIPLPYDESRFQIDYERLNCLIEKEKPDLLVFCQSDLLQPPEFELIKTTDKTCILYDCTQTLGLVGSGVLPNPLTSQKNMIMIGGTHKTLPAATCGLILTCNKKYIKSLDTKISPQFLRNVQPNNIAALLLAIIEQEQVGKEYQEKIVNTANKLGAELTDAFSETFGEKVFTVAALGNGIYTKTHQLFILSDREHTLQLYRNAVKYNVTLNKKSKPLFGEHNWGIRIGVQEIARYAWSDEDLHILAKLIAELGREYVNQTAVESYKKLLLSKKTPHYFLEDYFIK